MAKLPKSIIKKYGISKKAWSVFRSSKKNKSQSRGVSMAKRKTIKRKLGSRGSAKMNNVLKIVVGAGIVALYEVFLSPRIPLKRNMKNILEMVIGIILMMQRNVYLKSAGVALLTINAFEVIVPVLRGFGSKKAVSTSSVDAMLN